MVVEFRPEKAGALKRRFQAAISPVVREYSYAVADHPRHIFDYEDGLKLCISHDDYGDPHPGHCIHLSVGLNDGTDAYERYRKMATPVTKLKADVAVSMLMREGIERFRRLSGYAGHVHFAGLSSQGIPHLYVWAEEWMAEGLSLKAPEGAEG